MTIDRREFVVGAALAAVAPTLALLQSPSAAPATTVGRVAFMIDGWNALDDGGAGEQLWIRVGHSWRAAWR